MTRMAAPFEHALQGAADLVASDPAGALDQANGLAAQQPDPRAFRVAAAALRALDRYEEAARAELQGIRFGLTPTLQQARSAQRSRRSSEAKSLADDYLRSNPDDLLALTISAEAALGLNRVDEAEPRLRQVVDRAPAFAPANLLLANVLVAQLRLHEAAEILENFLRRVPHETSAKRFLADIWAQMNDPSGAASIYEDILASEPNNAASQVRYAHFLRGIGSRAESIGALRRAIALSPTSGNAWWTLAHYFPEELTDEDERQLRTAARNPAGQPNDLGFLQLAVSILDHRRGNHQAAFEGITSAQALLSQGPAYDPDSLSSHVDELIASYTPDVFARFEPRGSRSDSPIFIVGMPRSGSTLLERILGQHSKIEAIGESPVIPRLVAIEHPDRTAAYTSLLPSSISGEKLAYLAEWYLQRSQEYRHTDKRHFTDKYNGNWIRTGLIRLMFPKAKILDIRRNALDNCWAVFKSVRVGDYANDQRHLARYYGDYVRFMDAMAAASPSSILTVRYEELVADVEAQTRRVLDFLGLDFEPACMDFHRSTAAVTTASSEQVRRPINSESIGSAEPYRRWLKPLVEELDSTLRHSPPS
jgi:tetratricopeptide (TPR) repeat protein